MLPNRSIFSPRNHLSLSKACCNSLVLSPGPRQTENRILARKRKHGLTSWSIAHWSDRDQALRNVIETDSCLRDESWATSKGTARQMFSDLEEMRADCSWELPKDAGYDGEPLIVIAAVQMGLVTLPPWLAFVPAECRVVTARLNIICMVGEFLTVLFFIKFRTNCLLLFTWHCQGPWYPVMGMLKLPISGVVVICIGCSNHMIVCLLPSCKAVFSSK